MNCPQLQEEVMGLEVLENNLQNINRFKYSWVIILRMNCIIKNGVLTLPNKFLTLDYLLDNNVPIEIAGNEYILEIKITKIARPELEYSRVIGNNPELLNLIHSTEPVRLLSYGECILCDYNIIISLIWINKIYFKRDVGIFIPKKFLFHFMDSVKNFNECIIINSDFFLKNLNVMNCDLESLENFEPKKDSTTIFFNSNFDFNGNKRRINTSLKKIIKRGSINVLSSTLLDILDIPVLLDMDKYKFKTKPLINFNSMFDNYSLIDFEEDSFIDLVNDMVNDNKRIYMSLSLKRNEQVRIIKDSLIDLGLSVSKTDDPDSDIVINLSKTTFNLPKLNNYYDVYILILPKISDPFELINYFKFIGENECEIIFDSSNIDDIEDNMKLLTIRRGARIVTKDSDEYETYEKTCSMIPVIQPIIQPIIEPIIGSDYYYRIEPSEVIRKMNLSNLERNEYNFIRNYVINKLDNKYGIQVKTCQLSTPCSPKDRSTKLNSLSNKISSFNYRCDITCEIFKDYSIGVIVWSELFSNRKKLDVEKLRNQVFIYQVTNGNWKYSVIK